MLAFFCLTMTLVVAGLIVYPKSYSSDARLFVRLGRENLALDPTAAVHETVTVNETRESEINSEVEMLRSRVLLQDVVDELGAEYVLGGTSQPDGEQGERDKQDSWLQTVFAGVNVAKTWLSGIVSPEERAIERLIASISITAPRRSNVILVNCKGKDPAHAQRVLQAFLDAYMHRHVKANRTPGSHEFFVDQSELLAKQLQQATEQLRDARNETAMVSIEGQRENVQAQATSIEAAILENDRALAASQAKIAALKKSLTDLPEEMKSEETAGLPNVAADEMRAELYRLQIQEKEASSRFTSLHPHVIALRRQVAEMEKILGEQKESRVQTTRSLSVVHQAVQTELAVAQALEASQRASAESLQQQYESVKAKIHGLNNDEVRITKLSRDVELLEVNYRNYLKNREQARIDEELVMGRISNVNIVQPASFVAKPTSPRAGLTLFAGFFAATFGSLLLAFVCEFFDKSLKTSEQIEQELGMPVLFSVPRGARHELLHQ